MVHRYKLEAGLAPGRADAASEAAPVPVKKAATGAYAYIDAVRGWAILLVMTTHVGGRFAELPFPVKKLTNFGWNGVQLFFLASAITLALSWRRSATPFPRKTFDFFIRRFLRIAPMYYAGALLYMLTWPPGANFDAAQLLRTLLFINTWQPDWVPTTPGWMVVPGGWSIGVEFCFYALFPILITLLTTLRRAIIFAVASMVAAVACNALGTVWFSRFGEPAVGRFLYFWFPNQLPVFAIGVVVYHVLANEWVIGLSRRAGILMMMASLLAFAVAAEHPASSDRFAPSLSPPQILIVALAFGVFVVALARSPPGLFVHPLIQRLGVLSFSCYVLHFWFVGAIPHAIGEAIDLSATGLRAVVMAGLLWLMVVAATIFAATITHRLIEQPGIRLAHRLTQARPRAASVFAA